MTDDSKPQNGNRWSEWKGSTDQLLTSFGQKLDDIHTDIKDHFTQDDKRFNEINSDISDLQRSFARWGGAVAALFAIINLIVLWVKSG